MASYKNQNSDLDKRIALLEVERDIQKSLLKRQLSQTFDSIKPVNLLKDSLEDFNSRPDLKSSLLQSTLSIAGGYLSKKLVMGKSNSTFKKIVGYVLQYGITTFISQKVNSTK